METPTPTATFTPEIPPTETPTATPAPELLIVAPVVNVRQGPSIAYGIIGQVRQDERYQLTGRNDNDSWWQICCIGADLGWITSQLTAPSGPVDSVPIASAPQLPPTPFPSDTPLPTPLPTPSWRFWLSEGPEPWETNNAWLTIWLKTYIGSYPNTVPVPGYRLKVFRNGVDVSQPDMTLDRYQWSAPSVEGDPTAFGNRRQYNLKYEYHPQAGDAEWRIYLVDGSGAAGIPGSDLPDQGCRERQRDLRQLHRRARREAALWRESWIPASPCDILRICCRLMGGKFMWRWKRLEVCSCCVHPGGYFSLRWPFCLSCPAVR